MGEAQRDFLAVFKKAFAQRFSSEPVDWVSGQVADNVAQLHGIAALRRDGILKPNENFELGDLRTNFLGLTIIVEYEKGSLVLSNLLKYWPYIRGELSVKPERSLVLCHFSDWSSYGAYRDLWDWVMRRMQADGERIVSIMGRQFDHGSMDMAIRNCSLQEALDWIAKLCNSGGTVNA